MMTTHLLLIPVAINMGDTEIERTVDIDTDDAGQVWMWDQTFDEDAELTMQTTCFPSLDDAERVALRMLAASEPAAQQEAA